MSVASRLFPIFASLAAAAVFVGCSSDGKQVEERSEAVATMKDVRAEFTKARDATTNVSKALTNLQTTNDVPKAFAELTDAIAKSDKAAEKVGYRWTDLEARREEYRARWDTEMASIKDPEVRKSLEARRKNLSQSTQAIVDAAQAVKNTFKPYNQRLHELQMALKVDPTPEAVKGLKNSIAETQRGAATVNARIDDLQSLLAELSPEMQKRS